MMTLKGRTVAVLVEDLYQEMEVWYPLLRLREEGAADGVCGEMKNELTGTDRMDRKKTIAEVAA